MSARSPSADHLQRGRNAGRPLRIEERHGGGLLLLRRCCSCRRCSGLGCKELLELGDVQLHLFIVHVAVPHGALELLVGHHGPVQLPHRHVRLALLLLLVRRGRRSHRWRAGWRRCTWRSPPRYGWRRWSRPRYRRRWRPTGDRRRRWCSPWYRRRRRRCATRYGWRWRRCAAGYGGWWRRCAAGYGGWWRRCAAGYGGWWRRCATRYGWRRQAARNGRRSWGGFQHLQLFLERGDTLLQRAVLSSSGALRRSKRIAHGISALLLQVGRRVGRSLEVLHTARPDDGADTIVGQRVQHR